MQDKILNIIQNRTLSIFDIISKSDDLTVETCYSQVQNAVLDLVEKNILRIKDVDGLAYYYRRKCKLNLRKINKYKKNNFEVFSCLVEIEKLFQKKSVVDTLRSCIAKGIDVFETKNYQIPEDKYNLILSRILKYLKLYVKTEKKEYTENWNDEYITQIAQNYNNTIENKTQYQRKVLINKFLTEYLKNICVSDKYYRSNAFKFYVKRITYSVLGIRQEYKQTDMVINIGDLVKFTHKSKTLTGNVVKIKRDKHYLCRSVTIYCSKLDKNFIKVDKYIVKNITFDKNNS